MDAPQPSDDLPRDQENSIELPDDSLQEDDSEIIDFEPVETSDSQDHVPIVAEFEPMEDDDNSAPDSTSAQPDPAQTNPAEADPVEDESPVERLPMPDPEELGRLIEAYLFVGERPLRPEKWAGQFEGLTAQSVLSAIDRLNQAYDAQQRAIHIIAPDDEGYRLKLRPMHRERLQAVVKPEKSAKLSRQAMEVLSIVAYRQPVTRLVIEQELGVDMRGPLRQLVRRELIEVLMPETGRKPKDPLTVAYQTTARFLAVFGLPDLDALPRLDMSALEAG